MAVAATEATAEVTPPTTDDRSEATPPRRPSRLDEGSSRGALRDTSEGDWAVVDGTEATFSVDVFEGATTDTTAEVTPPTSELRPEVRPSMMPALLDGLGEGDAAAGVGGIIEGASAAPLFELLGDAAGGAELAASGVTSLDTMELTGSSGCAAEAVADEATDTREDSELVSATLAAAADLEGETVGVGSIEEELLWPSSPSPRPSTAEVRPPKRPPSPPRSN